jgi:uncharacterized membrane protein YdjX (TVP38/TMEM64 family)
MRAVLAGIVLALLFRFGGRLASELHRLEAFIAGLGAWAPVGFVLVFLVLLPLFVPVSAMKLTAGALFGPWLGLLLALLAQLAASVLMYFLGRSLFAARLQAFVAREPKLAPVARAAEEGTAKRQFLVRMTPLSSALVSYVLAGLGVRLRPFLIGCLATVPSTVASVWFAHAAVSLPDLASSATRERLHSMTVALAVVVLGFAVVAWLVRAARRALLANADEHERGVVRGVRRTPQESD